MESSRGALAFGTIPEVTFDMLTEIVRRKPSCRILAVDDSRDDANVGSMVRTASCMGCDVVLVSATCARAWSRRAIRTSMGHIFRIPVVRCDLPATLR